MKKLSHPSHLRLAALVFATAGTFALLPPAADAAKKYYPPGFTPPSDSTMAPIAAPQQQTPPPQPVIIQQPGQTQVIIKTVPVQKVIVKPKDPMTVLLEEQRFYEALRLVEKRLKEKPNDLSLQMLRGQILREEGNFDEAVKTYQAVNEKTKNKYTRALALNGIAWTDYGHGLYAQSIGDNFGAENYMNRAEDNFRAALRLNPNLTYAWTGLGQWYLSQGDVEGANIAIKRALRLAPNDVSVQLTHSQLLLAQNKAEDALPILFNVKAKNSHNPVVYLLLGKASLETDRVDDAIIHLKQLIGMVPDHPEALRLLSECYARKAEPKQAEDILQKAISLNPGDVNSLRDLLKIYDDRNEPERAILTLQTQLKILPEQQWYRYELMKRLARQDRWEEVYQLGSDFVTTRLAPGKPEIAAQDRGQVNDILNYFVKSAYERGRGMLDRKPLLNEPAVQTVKTYTLAQLQQDPDNLCYRLNLLLLDPLVELPRMPVDYVYGNDQLPHAIMISFLRGNRDRHSALLSQWTGGMTADGKDLDATLQTARELLLLGDYDGARQTAARLTALHPANPQVLALRQQVDAQEKEATDHLKSLSLLPKRIPDSYWEKAAEEALRLSSGNWEMHALLAEQLSRRDQPALALRHQKLASRYAVRDKDKAYWDKKAKATERSLAKSRGRK